MTREEFYKLAVERPGPENESVLELRIYDYDHDIQGYSRQTEGKWSFEIRCCLNLLYSTLEKSGIAMKEFMRSERYTDTFTPSKAAIMELKIKYQEWLNQGKKD